MQKKIRENFPVEDLLFAFIFGSCKGQDLNKNKIAITSKTTQILDPGTMNLSICPKQSTLG